MCTYCLIYNKHIPLDFLENVSTSVVKPNPEPQLKPPPPLEMLISLKLLSILPDPIDYNIMNPPSLPINPSQSHNKSSSYRPSKKRLKQAIMRHNIRPA